MDEVWVSDWGADGRIGNKQGLAFKFYGHEWEEKYIRHEVPAEPSDVRALSARHYSGESLKREEMTEAAFIYDESRFKRLKELFIAGAFYGVRGKLAQVLGQADLGTGCLYPFPIYQEDKQTLQDVVEGPFYLLNFGAQKNSFLPDESNPETVRPFFTLERHGIEVWESDFGTYDDDVAVSAAAFDGPDIWFEPKLSGKIFMSDRLVKALRKAKVKVNFDLKKCRVVGGRA